MVNRVWMHHFGQGLVATPSDFGHRAEEPTHPELLDWLSRAFIESGWRLKSLHRMILLSRAYRQDSRGPTEVAQVANAIQKDPDNHLLWRMADRRLSFEEARDSWLAASGELDLSFGGRPLTLFSKQNSRRTLYAFVDREDLAPVLRMFDFANPDLSIAQRNSTTVPQQALFAMNHPFIAERVTHLTRSVATTDIKAGIDRLYADLYQRKPTDHERQLATSFLNSDPSAFNDGSAQVEGETRAKAWSYGFGEFDSTTGKVIGFTPLPHFSGSAWQGGSSFPDAALGWVQLSAVGGHPGNDLKHAVVRRWTAPSSGRVQIRSKLEHEPTVGDGIRGFLCHSRTGLLKSTTVHHNSEQMDAEADVDAGDTIDFITDIGVELNSDQFLWSAAIHRQVNGSSSSAAGEAEWNSTTDFRGLDSDMLDRWGQLAQVLMLANEFMFVD